MIIMTPHTNPERLSNKKGTKRDTEIYLGKGYKIDFACGLGPSENGCRGIWDGRREYGKR